MKDTLTHLLNQIQHNQDGFQHLLTFYHHVEKCFFEDINVDIVGWFDADMCAVLGAILYKLTENANSISLDVKSDAKRILAKNGFLSHYGREALPDTWGTTVPYERFDVNDDRYFGRYIVDHLMHRSELPSMSAGVAKRFRESVFEIFSNAVIHSQTRLGIFCCGQFFPNRHRLNFIIADLGIGIRQNVNAHTGLDLSAEAAIDWATKGNNTTKRGPIPGGLGLKLLREFIKMNGGCIQIVSDRGYWRQDSANTSMAQLPHPFPGTVVTLEINTIDTQAYTLEDTIAPQNIF